MLRNVISKLLFICNRLRLRMHSSLMCWLYNFSGKNIYIGKGIRVTNPHCIIIGDNVTINDYVDLNCNYSFSAPPQLKIGDGTWVGRNCTFGCDNKIEVGRDVVFGPCVHITDRDHEFRNVELPLGSQSMTTKGPVVIEDETWIGFGAQIMSGVTIGKHCVIAAGSIVTKSFPNYTVIAGNPAVAIKHYDFNTNSWIK